MVKARGRVEMELRVRVLNWLKDRWMEKEEKIGFEPDEEEGRLIIAVKMIPLDPLGKEVEEGWYGIPDGCTACQLLLQLGFPEERAAHIRVLRNGMKLDKEAPLIQGDIVALLPTFAGG